MRAWLAPAAIILVTPPIAVLSWMACARYESSLSVDFSFWDEYREQVRWRVVPGIF